MRRLAAATLLAVSLALAPGGSWEAAYIDASQSPYNVGPTGDQTANAQAALNDAFNGTSPQGAGIKKVIFPRGFSFSVLAIYSDIELECGGDANPLVRTAVGPGLYTTTAPGVGYPPTLVLGVTVRNCTFNDGAGLAGSNFTPTEAQQGRFINVHSTSALTGAEFTGWGSPYPYLTAGVKTNGVPAVGMVIVCPGCQSTANDNTWPQLLSTTDGTHFTPTGNMPTVTSREIVGVVPWTWTLPTPATWIAAQHNLTFPSAAIFYMGATSDTYAEGMSAGGATANGGSACDRYTGIGLWLDTTQKDGGNRPNHDTFVNSSGYCANLAVGVPNGSDNTWVGGPDFQFSNYGMMIGIGPGGAARNIVSQPYCEGGAATGEIMEECFGLGDLSSWTQIVGSGSLSYAPNPSYNGTPPKVDYGTNNTWATLH